MKKVLAILLASLVLLTACASKGNNAPNTGGKTAEATPAAAKEITVWAWDKVFNIGAMERAKELTRRKIPIPV